MITDIIAVPYRGRPISASLKRECPSTHRACEGAPYVILRRWKEALLLLSARDFVKRSLSFFTSRRPGPSSFSRGWVRARYVAGTPDTTRRELQLRNRILLLRDVQESRCVRGDGLLNVIILGGLRSSVRIALENQCGIVCQAEDFRRIGWEVHSRLLNSLSFCEHGGAK